MARNSFNYGLAFNSLQGFFDFKIRKNKKNFTPREKALIKKITNSLTKEGIIYFDEEKSKYIQPFKFVRTGAKEKLPGIKQTLNGRFVRGARKNQKTRGNTIIGDHYDKIFIPLDLLELEERTDLGEAYEDAAYDIITRSLSDYFPSLKKADYFTVVVANGWEIGRGNVPNNKPKKSIQLTQKNGKTYKKRVTDKEAVFERKEAAILRHAENVTGRKRKSEIVGARIIELIERIHNIHQKNTSRYKLGVETISGMYLYKFKKQRKPTKGEKNGLGRRKTKK